MRWIATSVLVALCANLHAEDISRANYQLKCAGCHGLEGVSNSERVPDLKDRVGRFLAVSQGRDYLVRLPNVAFSQTTDQELSDILNYVVFSLGGDSAPRGARPYTASEISPLRKRPLNEVSLIQVRRSLVRELNRIGNGPNRAPCKPSSRCAKTAPSRGLDYKHIAGVHLNLGRRRQLDDSAIGSFDPPFAWRAWRTSVQPERRYSTTV